MESKSSNKLHVSYQLLNSDNNNSKTGKNWRGFVRKTLTGALLLVVASLAIIFATYPDVLTSGHQVTMLFLNDLGRQAGLILNNNYSPFAFSSSPPPKPALKTFHEEACEHFFPLANCSERLFAKKFRKQHQWPSFNSTDDFFDFRRVLLVLHYNVPNYESAAKDYALYGNIFAKIVFCGPENSEDAFWPHLPSTRVNKTAYSLPPELAKFVAFGSYVGSHTLNNYICLPLALEKEPGDYDGALVMSDDVVVNYWNFKAIGKSLDKIWALKDKNDHPFDIDSTRFCVKNSTNNSVDCRPGIGNWIWPRYNQAEILKFYDHLNALANGSAAPLNESTFSVGRSPTEWTIYWRRMKENLVYATGGERRLLGLASGDCFYVPKKYFKDLLPFLRLLGSHRIFLEIGVVTALRTVAPPGEIQLLSFEAQDWGQGGIRDRPFIEAYKMSYEIVHPFKLSAVNSHFQFENETHLAELMKERPVDVSTSCVYCNLVRLATAYIDFIDSGRNVIT